MISNRFIASAVFAAAFISPLAALTVPAQAASGGTVSDNGDGTATVTWTGFAAANHVVIYMGCTGPSTPCYSVAPTTGTSGSVTIAEGMNVTATAGTVPLPAGTYAIKLGDKSSGQVPTPTVAQSGSAISIGSGGNSGTTETTAPSFDQPVPATLALDLAASGASCTEGSAVSGVAGAWMKLPAADACSSTTRPGAKLLGWSTSASFPVALAQSQVNKGWGAIDDTFNGVRMIFIPAGQSTFVSGSNALHPIWAS